MTESENSGEFTLLAEMDRNKSILRSKSARVSMVKRTLRREVNTWPL